MKSTLELYGVEPKILAAMRYDEALYVKLVAIRKRKDGLAMALSNSDLSYEECAAIQQEFKAASKAIAITSLQLEEIK